MEAPEEWQRVWKGVRDLSDQFGERIIFIGGVAVYLHVKGKRKAFIGYSHDGDFYISLEDFAELRDAEEVVSNKRLGKHQVIKDGIDFDVYVERNNSLRVRYEDIEAASVVIDGVRVASLEHLLLLKLDAYQNRRGSRKGEKDETDVIRLGFLLSSGVDRKLLEPYLTEAMLELLRSVERSSQFFELCRKNAHEAKKLREAFHVTVEAVASVLSSPSRRR